MAAAPARKPEPFDAKAANVTFTPVVQIGPDFSGQIPGYWYGNSVSFYVSLGAGDPSQTYAWYMPNGGQWTQIPNNQQINVTGNPPISWYLTLPSTVSIKFLMGSA